MVGPPYWLAWPYVLSPLNSIALHWSLMSRPVLLSLTLTGVVAQAMKITVGRPRPDLIARCLPKPGSENGPVFGLVTAEICTQTDIFILKDGFRSFPSGHASCMPTPRSIPIQCSDVGFALVSFAGLGFLSFYLAGKIHLFVRLFRPPSFHIFYSFQLYPFRTHAATHPRLW